MIPPIFPLPPNQGRRWKHGDISMKAAEHAGEGTHPGSSTGQDLASSGGWGPAESCAAPRQCYGRVQNGHRPALASANLQ